MMEVEMEASSGYFDPEDLFSGEQFRSYGNRHSTPTRSLASGGNAAWSSKPGLIYDGHSIHSPFNAVLLLENIKHEADVEWRRLGSESINGCKVEDEMVSDVTETSFGLFAYLLDSAIRGLICYREE